MERPVAIAVTFLFLTCYPVFGQLHQVLCCIVSNTLICPLIFTFARQDGLFAWVYF